MRVINGTTEKDFVFSVVIAAYNSDKYIAKAIKSVVKQTIGFNNIQLIISNDGSSDDTEAIALEYVEKYPENIIYIGKENGGVSSARNIGIAYATGKYINFLDSDDVWSKNAFEEAYSFFQKNPDIKIATSRIQFTGSRIGDHPLNYKYCDEDKIVDMFSDYNKPQLSASAAFFEKSVFEKIKFDHKVDVLEDFKLVTEIVYKEKKYGLLSKPVYKYRKHQAKTSALGKNLGNVRSYYNCLKVGEYLMDLSVDCFGETCDYIKYAVVYDLLWRLHEIKADEDSEISIDDYYSLYRKLLSRIDDEIIMEVKPHTIDKKRLSLAIKYGISISDLDKTLKYNNGKYCLSVENKDIFLDFSADTIPHITIDFIHFDKKDCITLIGRMPYGRFSKEQVELAFDINEKRYKSKLKPLQNTAINATIDEIPEMLAFEVTLPIRGFKSEIKVACAFAGGESFSTRAFFGYFAPLNHKYPEYSYTICGNYFLIANHNGFTVKKSLGKALEQRTLEKRYLCEISKTKTGKKASKYRQEDIVRKRKRSKSQLWLVSDCVEAGRGAGEKLFEYLCTFPQAGVEPVFVISDNSKDFERLKKYGTVISAGSEEHKLFFLNSSRVIFSSLQEEIYYPFASESQFLKDLFKMKYVLLQNSEDNNSSDCNQTKMHAQSAGRFYCTVYESESNVMTDEIKKL